MRDEQQNGQRYEMWVTSPDGHVKCGVDLPHEGDPEMGVGIFADELRDRIALGELPERMRGWVAQAKSCQTWTVLAETTV